MLLMWMCVHLCPYEQIRGWPNWFYSGSSFVAKYVIYLVRIISFASVHNWVSSDLGIHLFSVEITVLQLHCCSSSIAIHTVRPNVEKRTIKNCLFLLTSYTARLNWRLNTFWLLLEVTGLLQWTTRSGCYWRCWRDPNGGVTVPECGVPLRSLCSLGLAFSAEICEHCPRRPALGSASFKLSGSKTSPASAGLVERWLTHWSSRGFFGTDSHREIIF